MGNKSKASNASNSEIPTGTPILGHNESEIGREEDGGISSKMLLNKNSQKV
jgi:hypothetical protein